MQDHRQSTRLSADTQTAEARAAALPDIRSGTDHISIAVSTGGAPIPAAAVGLRPPTQRTSGARPPASAINTGESRRSAETAASEVETATTAGPAL